MCSVINALLPGETTTETISDVCFNAIQNLNAFMYIIAIQRVGQIDANKILWNFIFYK